MNEINSPNEPDGLQRIVDALVDMSVPTGPDDEVKQHLLATLQSEERLQAEQSTHHKRGVRTMRRITSLAAAVLSAVAIGWVIMQMSANPREAFAAMVEQIQTIRTATYTTKISTQGHQDITFKTSLLEPAWMRSEMKINNVDLIHVFELREGKILSLFPKTQTASLVEITGQTEKERQKHVIDEFRKMTSESATYLGRETVGGLSALKYKVDHQGEYYTVWLDPADDLPVKVEMTDVSDAEQATSRMIMTDFVWNAELDESQFSFDLPEGYALQPKVELADDGRVGEFVKLLGFLVRLNEDNFLEEFNTMTMVSTIQKQLMRTDLSKEERQQHAKQKLAYALKRPDIVDMSGAERLKLGLELGQSFGQGSAFYERTIETHHWHYQGKGVKLGEADKIVAWWYPNKEKAEADADLDTAHVLYGDLRIEAMPVDELPQGDE